MPFDVKWRELRGHEEGLSALDEAIQSSRQSGVPYWDAELQRRKGELLLVANNVDRAAAEACMRRAIKIAQGQGAKSLELRVATSLGRLLAEQVIPSGMLIEANL